MVKGAEKTASSNQTKVSREQAALMRERARMHGIIYNPRSFWEGESYHPKGRYVCLIDYYSDECSCTPGGPEGCCPDVWSVSEAEAIVKRQQVKERRDGVIDRDLELCRLALEKEHGHHISPDASIQLLLEEYQRLKRAQTKDVSADVAWKAISEAPEHLCSCDKVWRCSECGVHFTEGTKCPVGCSKVPPYLSRAVEATPLPVHEEHGGGGGGGGGGEVYPAKPPPPLPISGLHWERSKCEMCGEEECSCNHAPPAPREETG